MFSFFKKKTPPAETAAAEKVAEPVAIEPAATAATQAPDEPVAPVVIAQAAAEPPRKASWTERLKAGLSKTRDKLGKQLATLFGGGKIDEDLYEELETVLLTADMGVDATNHLLKDVRDRVSLGGLKDASELKGTLKASLGELIGPLEVPLDTAGKKPFVIMMVGVNGAGKTTSIGKLAKYFQSQGKSVLLAAGDTFRAAAREQLMAWGERNNVTVIAQQSGDAAAVCYDAIQAATARGIDIVLADTAGRLPTQLHLMEEIKKVKRVIQKAIPDGPHEVMLVLDANIGQNAINQVIAFDDALGLTGLVLTKLDGTAKGGVIAAIAKQRPVPLRFIGVGESIDDLRPFQAGPYIDALFD
ncbi:signal recognition particle-docking protein FtsY [Vogesella sp. DC21W]|uniref:Signal recognition particle receptor FtsY n=1 Tax=Vogesella aquatica TaxID=2984206 RepID=A0ABT5IV16_9NEIS|nr:signal recognition particle-docking protein FtsY [Vogesella aquatica]MDC7716407.1 signal recognition particle-docking protein FtsY [Vogesella aquatica]